MFEFVIQSILASHKLDTAEGRLQALRRTVPVVAGIRDKPLQMEYARRLSGWVGWDSPDEVVAQVRKESAKVQNPQETVKRARRFDNDSQRDARQDKPGIVAPNPRDTYLWPQRESLKLALQYPQHVGEYFDGLGEDVFSNEAYRAVRAAIYQAGGVANASDGVDWIAAVAEHMADLVGRSLVSELAVEEIRYASAGLQAYVDMVLSRLQEARVGDQIAQLKAQLQRMRPSDDEQTYHSLFADLVALEQARRDLIARAFR